VQDAYTLLGAYWREVLAQWQAPGHSSPPVMLTLGNRTETAARIEHYFRKGDAHWPELHAPERTLRVDSKVLDKAEIGESAGVFGVPLSIFQDVGEGGEAPEPPKPPLNPARVVKSALLAIAGASAVGLQH
jgi:type III restriction enzyme